MLNNHLVTLALPSNRVINVKTIANRDENQRKVVPKCGCSGVEGVAGTLEAFLLKLDVR